MQKLVMPIYNNAAFPITQVNWLVSMSKAPCGNLLERFEGQRLAEAAVAQAGGSVYV